MTTPPGQHDHGAQILTDVFVTCSAEPQSPLNAWFGRSSVFSLGTWPLKSTDSELLSIKHERTVHLLHHAHVSDQADRRSILRRHHNNVIIYQEHCAGPQTKSSRNRCVKYCNCPRQSACVKTGHKKARRLASSCLSWSPSARLGLPSLPLLLLLGVVTS